MSDAALPRTAIQTPHPFPLRPVPPSRLTIGAAHCTRSAFALCTSARLVSVGHGCRLFIVTSEAASSRRLPRTPAPASPSPWRLRPARARPGGGGPRLLPFPVRLQAHCRASPSPRLRRAGPLPRYLRDSPPRVPPLYRRTCTRWGCPCAVWSAPAFRTPTLTGAAPHFTSGRLHGGSVPHRHRACGAAAACQPGLWAAGVARVYSPLGISTDMHRPLTRIMGHAKDRMEA
mmetsp:Transcript_19069/g.33100  ORF Transcript_19069/g.33100 Transcript_19069/m.33100 type:complete len:231 (-) Transcript_19069:994-1686(-)